MKELTQVVNLYKDSYDIYIGRAGKGQDGYYGNPHPVNKPCSLCNTTHQRGEAVEAFKKTFQVRIQSDEEYKNRVLQLRGKTLGCFCAPNACHGDIYKQYLDSLEI